MSRIVRLTERDMSRLVRKVIKEQRMLNEGVCGVGEHEIEQLKQGAYQATQGKEATFNATVSGGVSCWYLDVKIGNTNYNVLL
jgi:hypothetical protein